MLPVRRDENGNITYEPTGDEERNIQEYCPVCGKELDIVEWEATNLETFEMVKIVGGYCDECNSIMDRKICMEET